MTGPSTADRAWLSFRTEPPDLVMASESVASPFLGKDRGNGPGGSWSGFWPGMFSRGMDGVPPCPTLFDPEASPGAKARALLEWLRFWVDRQDNSGDRTVVIVKPDR